MKFTSLKSTIQRLLKYQTNGFLHQVDSSLDNQTNFDSFRKENEFAFPLINAQHRFCLFFSAKAGCTTATKWFFFHLEKLEEALKYHDWIHRYRSQVYYKTDQYRRSFPSIMEPDFLRFKLVRNPYTRAVSSYIHAIKTGYLDVEMTQHLGREVSTNLKFSFEQFVDFLEASDLTMCNPHHRRQVFNLEQKGILQFHKIIKLESIESELRELEVSFRLNPSDLEKIFRSSHHRYRQMNSKYCGDIQYSAESATFGLTEEFYSELIGERIYRLYRDDFTQYDYSPELIRR